MFGGFGSRFAKFGTGGGGRSIASSADLLQLFKRGSEDGAMIDELDNTTDLDLTNVNCLSFDGSGDYVKVDSSGGVDLTTNAGNHFGSCVITATFKQEVATTQAIYSNGSAAYRLFTQNNFLKVNSSSAEIFAIELNKVYQSTITYNANGQLTNFVLENLTDGTTQTDSNIRPAGSHGGSGGFQIGARNGGLSWKGKISNVSVSNSSVGANIHLPLAEGSGSVAYDVSGNGANGTIINATHSTLDDIESWNHEYGFDTDIFKGYAGYWSLAAAADGTWTVNESNLTLAGNAGTSSKLKQVVDGMVSGDTLVVSGTITQTTGQASGSDVAISATSAGWSEGSVYIGGQIGTYTFSTTLNSTSSNCDIRLIALNGANLVISDLKFTVVKKIPALNTKTKQVATFDGVDDYVDTGVSDQLVKKYSVTFTPTVINDGVLLGLRIFRPACLELLSDGSMRTALSEGEPEARGNSLGANRTTTTTIVAGAKYTVEVDYDNNEIKINDVVQSTFATSGQNHRNDNVWIGGREDFSALQNPFNGIIHNVKLESATAVLAEYDFQSDIGTTNIVDVSSNGNDGDLTYGAGALESFWGTRVADASGSLVSADYAAGNLAISNQPALDNNSEVDLIQTDSVFTSGTVSFWSADGSAQDEKTFAQLIDHAANRNGYHRVWVKVADGRVIAVAQYNLDKDFLPNDVLKNERYFGGTSGALRDVNGDFIVDGSGFVTFAG